jgi:hypothetical protein
MECLARWHYLAALFAAHCAGITAGCSLAGAFAPALSTERFNTYIVIAIVEILFTGRIDP